MNFDLNEDQKLLVQTVAAFARKDSPLSRARALREDPRGFDPAMWRRMGDLGWLALPFPESAGGLGGRFVDVALLLGELGRTLVPEPYVPSVVLAGTVLARAGDAAQRARWLEPLMAGETTAALACWEDGAGEALDRPATRAERGAGGGWRILGEKAWVLAGHAADTLVVSAACEGGVGLFALPRETPGVQVRRVATLDGRGAARIAFEGVALPAEALLGDPAGGAALLALAMDLGAAAACAEGAAVMDAALQMTLDYLRARKQFGVAIGAFQALQHRAVDMFVETELMRSMSLLAAIEADSEDGDARRAAVSAAKVHLSEGGRFVTQQAIQLHGGIGISDEHDIGLYFKRMEALCALFGGAGHHLARLAARPDLGEAAA